MTLNRLRVAFLLSLIMLIAVIASAGTVSGTKSPVPDAASGVARVPDELSFPRISADQTRPKKIEACDTTCYDQHKCIRGTSEWDCLAVTTHLTCKANLYCDDCIGGCEPPL